MFKFKDLIIINFKSHKKIQNINFKKLKLAIRQQKQLGKIYFIIVKFVFGIY